MAGVHMPRRRMRVVIYARVSQDHSSQGRSVGQQLKIGRKRAEENDWEVVGEFSDNDVSVSEYAGAGMAREDWPKVEALIRAGGVDILWLWELSRSTRDRIVWAHLVKACQDNNVYFGLDRRLWDVNEPDDMAYLDNLMIKSIHESGTTRKRVLRDMEEQAELGRPHGHAHYAYTREYDPETRELVRQVPHPERSKLMLEVIERVLVGKQTLGQIAADLNRRGVPTPHGRLMGGQYTTKSGRVVTSTGWDGRTLQGMLSSPTLMGKRGHHGRVVSAGGWEALISEEEWVALQRAIAPQPLDDEFQRRVAATLQTGITVCDVCEAPLRAKRKRSKNRVPPSYQCRGKGKGSAFHGARSIETLDAALEALLLERLGHPDVRAALVPRSNEKTRVRAEKRIAELEEELQDLERALRAKKISWQMAGVAEEGLRQELEEVQRQAVPVLADPLLVELAEGDPVVVWKGWELPQKRAALRLLTKPKGIRMLVVGKGKRNLPPEAHLDITWAGVGVSPAG